MEAWRLKWSYGVAVDQWSQILIILKSENSDPHPQQGENVYPDTH
jgi:hypothetical protein